ncbi:hypothetical protein BJ138DRAFT_595855 [Hygrophoropsis aurantiaca]|uniref:Uncharacterized protein n=1 Tax=Hygrophoropsis aurantiaca TaxID=72124 RepID=A0ACB8AS90_9AGAM|nr:hypothetical protein BJ138DRAFT_595855 [Hygrophoropsis aurantiaca]
MPQWDCSLCPKSFTRKGDLARHEQLHSGIKPYLCEICGKSFAQHSGLKTHHNVHSKAKPYECGIGNCKKSFGDPSSCTRHRKETHNPDAVYKCVVDDCTTRIKRRSAFVAHLKKHNIDPATVDLDAMMSHVRKRKITIRQSSPPTVTSDKSRESMDGETPVNGETDLRLNYHLSSGTVSYEDVEFSSQNFHSERARSSYENSGRGHHRSYPSPTCATSFSWSFPPTASLEWPPQPYFVDNLNGFDQPFAAYHDLPQSRSSTIPSPYLASPLELPLFDNFDDHDNSSSSSSSPSSSYSSLSLDHTTEFGLYGRCISPEQLHLNIV